jgi:hypothetical protein
MWSQIHTPRAPAAPGTPAQKSPQGVLMAFLDDDVEWLPSYLAEALLRFELKDLDVIYIDPLRQFDDGIDRAGKLAPDNLAPELFLTRNYGLIGSNIIIKRSFYCEIGGFDESLPTGNDRDFGLQLSLRSKVNYERLPKWPVRVY